MWQSRQQGGTNTRPTDGWYELDDNAFIDAFIDAFDAQFEEIYFGEGFDDQLYEMCDYLGLGKRCVDDGSGDPPTHCDELIMVAVQFTVRVNEAA